MKSILRRFKAHIGILFLFGIKTIKYSQIEDVKVIFLENFKIKTVRGDMG